MPKSYQAGATRNDQSFSKEVTQKHKPPNSHPLIFLNARLLIVRRLQPFRVNVYTPAGARWYLNISVYNS